MAPGSNDFWLAHRDAGFITITALRDADEAELLEWTVDLALDFPVLGDVDGVVWEAWREGTARPQYVVLDRDHKVVDRGEGVAGHEQTQQAVLGLLDAAR